MVECLTEENLEFKVQDMEDHSLRRDVLEEAAEDVRVQDHHAGVPEIGLEIVTVVVDVLVLLIVASVDLIQNLALLLQRLSGIHLVHETKDLVLHDPSLNHLLVNHQIEDHVPGLLSVL